KKTELMYLKMEVTPDMKIPAHVYNEAAELFLNHLRKYSEEQLRKDGSSLLTSQYPKKIEICYMRQINPLGESCPAVYKNAKGIRNVLLTPELRKRNTQF
ncbi:hypothetical protein PGK51_12540, partial [Riemerella anatipestifer]